MKIPVHTGVKVVFMEGISQKISPRRKKNLYLPSFLKTFLSVYSFLETEKDRVPMGEGERES